MTRAAKRGIALALARSILEDLRKRSLPAGEHLREEALAGRFSVSRSPVRQALGLLARRGVVRQEPNRGFFLRKPSSELAPLPDEPPGDDPAEALYLRIADDRLRGALPGAVSEAGLVRRYAVPRWLAQRTLARLAGHGLVRRRPARGWEFPAELTSSAAYGEGYSFRLAIEPAALREPGYRVPRKEWERVREAQRRVLDEGPARFSRLELFRLGAEFHEAIVGWSGNRYFLSALRDLNQVRRLFESRVKVDRERIRSQTAEHLKILDLLLEGRNEAAARLLERHIGTARRRKAALLQK